jgi:4-hydroxy-tetrahydrodipicolinate reductase
MKLALFGYGKMGKTIERLAEQGGHSVVFKADKQFEEGDLGSADVAIEFSTPESAFTNIKRCVEGNIPVVSGTTGWLDKYDEVLKLCEERNGSFIYASNFSIGVNLFFSLNEYLADQMKLRKEYEASIEEIHHTEKKDAPSGTAISLAEGILKFSDKADWKLDSQDNDHLSIHSVREGEIKGIHKVTYRSGIDQISIRHEAFSRDGFATGAILAAEWLQNKEGVYSMKDVLGLA